MLGHLALDAFGYSADIREQSMKDIELFGQLLDALLKTFVVAHKQFDFFFRLAGAQFGLLARFTHGDIVALPTAAVLVCPLVGAFASA